MNCAFSLRMLGIPTAPLPTAAPNNDLQLLKSILAYGSVNAGIYKAG